MDEMISFWDDMTLPQSVTAQAFIVNLTDCNFVRRILILTITDFPTYKNLLNVKHVNVFKLYSIVTINDTRDINTLMISMRQNFNKCFHTVEKFIRWQKEVDSYRTTS